MSTLNAILNLCTEYVHTLPDGILTGKLMLAKMLGKQRKWKEKQLEKTKNKRKTVIKIIVLNSLTK